MKKVIYTSVVGNYDQLKDPTCKLKGWDYICFSNDLLNKDFKVWKILPINYSSNDRIILSRYPKFHPHEILNDYDVSLWLDANIEILSNEVESRLNELIQNESILISIAKHPIRDCVYAEGKECIKVGKEKTRNIINHLNFIRNEGYPLRNGMYENNIIFRKHRNEKIVSLNKMWWAIFLQYSKRDQLSLPYVLWKLNIQCEPLFHGGFDVRESKFFSYKTHTYTLTKKIQRKFRLINAHLFNRNFKY